MRGQIGLPKPMEASEKRDEMSPPRHECNKFHVQERYTADTTIIMVPFFPTISGEYPSLFLTSLTGIAYACRA